jgi:DNA-binding NtrC family response regulator
LDQELIRRALTRNKGNMTRTASELGVSRPTLHELVAKYAIER